LHRPVEIERLSPSYELLLPGFDAAEVHVHHLAVVEDFPERVGKEAVFHVTGTAVAIWEE
jgi:hypothetical protein